MPAATLSDPDQWISHVRRAYLESHELIAAAAAMQTSTRTTDEAPVR